MGRCLKGEQSSWLSNFGTNVLEYFKQYNVRLHEGGITNLQSKKENVQELIAQLKKGPWGDQTPQKIAAAERLLSHTVTAQAKFSKDGYQNLNKQQKELNDRAFTTNNKDPHFHDLMAINYNDKGEERMLNVPKGDVFHQFREDVKNGTLHTVAWLMPPARFSNHPDQPWLGPSM